MTIRLFNPDHDIALASGLENFTSPHAGRQLRSDLSFLPAVWSNDGDVVVVDDIDTAEAVYHKTKLPRKPKVEFCTIVQLPSVLSSCEQNCVLIDPWGWDSSIRFKLLKAGVDSSLLPSESVVEEIRSLSHRKNTINLLHSIREGIENATCGESIYVTDYDDFINITLKQENKVFKAPWSSSGRGVRYFLHDTDNDHLKKNFCNWVGNVIKLQGGVMVEPLYNKVKDFAIEFSSCNYGGLKYHGLSIFDTNKTAYTGNILATEEEKREMLANYIELSLLDEVTNRLEVLLSTLYGNIIRCLPNVYVGVDMMIVAKDGGNGFLLHPCVEVNLRRTMGHTAIALSPVVRDNKSMMYIVYEEKKYKLKVVSC